MRYYEVSNQEEFDQFLVELEKYIEEGKTEGIYLELLPNNYVTSKPIDIPSNFTLSGNNSEIKLVTVIEDWKNKGIIGAKGMEGETLNNIYIENLKVTSDKILGGEVLPKVSGISFEYVAESKIEGVKAEGVRYQGIYLSNSSNNVISGNTGAGNLSYGIYLTSSSNNNVISGNTVENRGSGIYVFNSSSNVVTGNTVSSNKRAGIYINRTSNSVVSGNITNNNGDGIMFGNSSSNIITGNISLSNTEHGIYLSDNDSNNIFYLNVTIGNGEGSYRKGGTGNDLSEEYNQFLEKAEG